MRPVVLACACLALSLASCRGGDSERPAPAQRGTDGLALPPSASAPRRSIEGNVPDTVTVAARPPAVRDIPGPDEPGPTESVGNVPPDRLDVGTIVAAYSRYYREIFHEMGSNVRQDVDPRLVEDAKRRTALELGFVQVSAWNQMVRELSGAERSDLAERIALANRDLAIELHGRMPR